jgi:hypothetical protein
MSSYYGLPRDSHLTFVTSTNTTTTGSLIEESRRNSIRIVLDYAYRDIGHGIRGGSCHLAQNREEGCALCDSLTEVERMAHADAPTENWWSEGFATRLSRRLYRWIRWGRGYRQSKERAV